MNNTKRSFLTSITALLLCISMLIGTTFAWFTDTVTSKNNIILAGNIDAEMYWSNELLAEDSTEWLDASQGAIFNHQKWEPGYTEVKYVKVVNNGSLNFKWKLGVEAEGPLGLLADVIDVYYVPNVATKLTNLNGLSSNGSLVDVLANNTSIEGGSLQPGKSAIVAIAFHMDEEAGNDYQGKSVCDAGFSVKLVATQEIGEFDSFGDDYDKDSTWPIAPVVGNSASASATAGTDGRLTQEVTMTSADGVIGATIPAGVKLEQGTNSLKLTISDVDESKANITLNETEATLSIDVHVEGVSEDNDVVMEILVKELLPVGLNMGNHRFYHVEDGATVEMNLLADGATPVHNNYEYDPATGDVVLYLKSFSEVALVADTVNAWAGEFDYNWYDASKTELVIANADQLAAFGAIVGGMNGQTQDSFSGKTIKLVSDINLGDKESENNPDIIFYPIGYYNSEGTYKRTNTAITSGLRNFEGTFDGNGHTVSNFYQNTWEMKGDHDWYSPEEQYYRDGMGLFGRLYGATVKNLTVKNFSSDGEITTTGVIAAYADGATFENIAIFNCNPRVYNIGNGGIVGCVGWYAKEKDLKTTFKNITVDNSNKISALWGSYDVACGGIVGQYYPTSGQTSANKPANGGIHFDNCHVSAVMDVYNDVCANYQYYAYRYTGMMIGSIRENETIDGRSYPKMDGITANGCTVHFGDWNDYYYCELVANTTASYTHDHQMSRLTQVAGVNVKTKQYLPLGEENWLDIPSGRVNYVVVKAKNNETGMWIHGDGSDYATCYHFVDREVWNHENAGYHDGENGEKYIDENGDGKADLKEDKQLVYREFNQLFTGYGWGVTSKGLTDFKGVENMDIQTGNHESSVEKFKGKVNALTTDRVYTLDEIFAYIEDCGVKVVDGAVNVTITNLDENGNVIATFNRGEKWYEGTISFENTGKIEITIQDYYFCIPTTITVNISSRQDEVKFDKLFNKDFLYRVGNVGTVPLDKLFKAKDGVTVGTVSVTVEAVNGTSASGTYSNNAIQFSGTGVVKVTIKDDDKYCIPTVLYLEVVDAKNVTSVESATSNNVVLLNDAGLSSLSISGGYAFYGNGFTLTYTGNGQYLGKGSGFKFGVVNVTEGGILDNVRIESSIYPVAALYSNQIKDYYEKDGDKTRYFYQLSAVSVSGNSTITNCYIYGGRNNIYVGAGNVSIIDTILENGTLSNMQIVSSDEYTVTLENVTTIQKQTKPTTYANDSLKNNNMLGFGILVGDADAENETTTNPKLSINGEFKQYNWVTQEDKNTVSDSYAQSAIDAALSNAEYQHIISGKTAANMGIVVLNTNICEIMNNSGLPYEFGRITIMNMVTGQVYSLQNATENQIYSDIANADRTTVNALYRPQFKFDDDLGGQYIENTDGTDEFLYSDGDTIKVMFPSGDSKVIDLIALVNIVKYTGQNLGISINVKDSQGNTVTVNNGKATFTAAGDYTVTYTVTDNLFYDKDGNTVAGSEEYSWDVTISVSLKEVGIPDAYFEFDATKQVIYRSGNSSIVQFIPFLAGLKIYDYNGQEPYLRFDGDNDFNKIAKASINNINTTGEGQGYHIVTIEFTDGGKLIIDMDVRANSGSSTHSGSIKVRSNVIYVVNNGTTSGKGQTWKIYSYKFVGNNGTEINSGLITFGTAGVDCNTATKPSSNFGTTVKYTVNYESNGGNCGQTVGYATSAATAVTLPTPTKSGYIFAGWYTAVSGGTRVGGAGDSYTPSANTTLYAQWGKPCDVTYDANGGSCGTASEKYTGTALTLPTPTRDGYWFIGWYDAAEGGNKIGDAGATYNPSGEITLYAHWQEAIKYTVTYNANGGTCGTASATYEGVALTLPTPIRTGYSCTGWYTAASGGTKVGDAGAKYTPTADITLYAQWSINSYVVTVKATNATVKVNGTQINNNGTVSIQYGSPVTVEVTYSEDKDRSTTIKGADGTTYNSPFDMPAQDVTITATSSCVTPDTLITLADGSQVRVDSLKGDEMLLVWNMETGKFDKAPIMFVDSDAETEYEIIKLYFSDGTEVKVIYEHGFWDYDLNKYVYLDRYAHNYIGHTFAKQNGDKLEKVTLVDVVIENEITTAWSPVTVGHLCYFVNGMLSMPGGVGGLFNIFEVNPETMTYDYEQLEKDIETYGLFTYEELNAICPLSEDMFNAAGGAYLKISIGKGNLTMDELIYMINRYSEFFN